MPRPLRRKRAAVAQLTFGGLGQGARPVGRARARPRSATGWSQGLALAALSPRTRRAQANERLRNGASFRATAAPACDELSVAAREFARTETVDDVALQGVLPEPSKINGCTECGEEVQLNRPRPLSAAAPARESRTARTRPHTAGKTRHDVHGTLLAAVVGRRPTTAQRQRIERYREGERQVLANKQVEEDKQLQTAGFRRQGPSRWVSTSSSKELVQRTSTVALDACAQEDYCAENESQLLQQYRRAIDADDSVGQNGCSRQRTRFFSFVAEHRQQLAAAGVNGEPQSLDPATIAMKLSKLWKDLRLEENLARCDVSDGGGGRGREDSSHSKRHAYIGCDRTASAQQVPCTNDSTLSASASIGAAAATWRTPQRPRMGANDRSRDRRMSRHLLDSDAESLLQIRSLSAPQSEPATMQSGTGHHASMSDGRRHSRASFGAVKESDGDERLLRLVAHSPELFTRPVEGAPRFSEPVSGSASLLQMGWCK